MSLNRIELMYTVLFFKGKFFGDGTVNLLGESNRRMYIVQQM